MDQTLGVRQKSKHEMIALEHITSLEVDKILTEAIKLLTRQDAIPANPYAILYRNVAFSKLKKEVMEELRRFTENYYPQQHYQCPTFDFIDADYYTRLRNSMEELLRPDVKIMSNAKITTYDSLGGGALFATKYIRATESAPSTITIFRTVTIEGCALEDAFGLFAGYVYGDITESSGQEEGGSIFISLQLETQTGPGPVRKETYTIEEILQNKAEFVEDVKTAAKNKRPVKLKMISRIPNPDGEFEGIATGDPNSSPAAEEQRCTYIWYNKYYGLHHVQKTGTGFVRSSFWHLPCVAYFEGIFRREDLATYMSFYEQYGKGTVPKPREYFESRCQKIIRAQSKGNVAKVLWYLLGLVLLEADAVRKLYLPNIFHALSHPSAQLCGLSKANDSLKYLVMAYQNTRNIQFKQSAESIFRKYRDDMKGLFAKGFAGEAICFKPFIETVLASLTRTKTRDLECENTTIELLDKLSSVTRCIGNSILTLLCKMNLLISETADYILKKLGKQPISEGGIMTIATLLDQKKPQYVINLWGEMAKNARTKTFPPEKETEYIYMQYFVDTDVYENLVSILREMMFGPSYPNLLAILEYRLQTLTCKYAVWEQVDEDVMRDNILKPLANAQPPTHMYLISTPELRNKGLGFCMGYEQVLSVCAATDISSFRKSFSRFEIPKALVQSDPEAAVRAIFAVSGVSILNSTQRMKAFGAAWIVTYDLVISGVTYDSALEKYSRIQVEYMKHLSKIGVVAGIFTTVNSLLPIINPRDLELAGAETKAAGVLLESQKDRYTTFIKIYFKHEATFLQVRIFFNLHFYNTMNSKMMSLLPVTNSHDVAKVFFTSEDFAEWDRIVSQPDDFSFLNDEINYSYTQGKVNCAIKAFIIKSALERRDIHDILSLIRLLYSDGEIFYNTASRIFSISAILEEKMLGNAAAQAVTVTDLQSDFDDARRLLEFTMRNENCVQMEGEQVRIYGLLADIKASFAHDVITGEYYRLTKKIRLLSNALFTLNNNSYLLLIDVLRSANKIAISKEGAFLRVQLRENQG